METSLSIASLGTSETTISFPYVLLPRGDSKSTLERVIPSFKLALEMILHVQEEPSSRSDVIERAEQLQSELIMQLTPQQVEAIQALAQAKTLESLVQEILAASQ